MCYVGVEFYWIEMYFGSDTVLLMKQMLVGTLLLNACSEYDIKVKQIPPPTDTAETEIETFVAPDCAVTLVRWRCRNR